MKKLTSILLALCMMSALVLVGAFPTKALATEGDYGANLAAVEEFNKTHGGTGKLFAELGFNEEGQEITIITGEVTGATKGISLLYVAWKAKLSGSTAGEALVKGDIEIMPGAEIRTDGRAIEVYNYLRVNGGIITATEAIYSDDTDYSIIFIGGGVITGDIYIK